MKKIISFFFSSLLISNLCYSQSGWFWQNPLPTSNTILKIKHLNSNFAMGVGDFGAVIKTTNGGILWTCLQNFTSSNLKSLCILDSSKIYVVGADGSVYRTFNSGINWAKVNLGISSQFNDILFVNALTGFIAGQGKILKTTNAGDNWSSYDINREIYNICFVNTYTGFLAGSSNTIYKTTNNGVNWSIINPEISSYWSSIYFKDENNGLLFGTEGKILKSTNGGVNWELTSTNTSETIITFGIKDSSILYAGGVNGILLKTTNFGINWTSLSSGQGSKMLSSILQLNDTSICTLGWKSCYPCQYDILLSFDNGINWSSQIKGSRYALNSIDFTNGNIGIVVGSGIILRTTDAGINWVSLDGFNEIYYAVQLLSNGTGYICGAGNTILKTTNNGLNWETKNTGYSTSENLGISFLNENTGIVVGYYSSPPYTFNYRILKTTNGGLSWSDKSGGINKTIYNVKIVDVNNVYLVGYGIYKSSNGGNNWILILSSNYLIDGIYFANSNTGVTAGVNWLYRTTNSGQNWTIQYYNQGASIDNFSFINEHTGWAVGYTYSNTRILKTNDGGITWNIYNGITAQRLNAVKMINENTIYAVGSEGTIIKSTNGGGNPINVNTNGNVIPSSFSLSQNYPNPFNPVTRIKFSLPSPSKGGVWYNVRLVIYDILGREVATLIPPLGGGQEGLKPGSYEVRWDGSRYASGVYFYKLITDEFVETRKMVLIK